DRAGAQRQRQRLPLLRLARRVRRAQRPATLHALATTANKREGRGARQDAAARVGLPLRLSLKRTPRTSAARLPALVQPTPATQLARRPTADQSRLTGLWVPQLAAGTARPIDRVRRWDAEM